MRFATPRFALLGAVVAIVLISGAWACAGTTFYWYGADATLGGAGAWDTTSTNWSLGSTTKTGVAWPNTSASDACFANAGGAVNLGGAAITAGSVNLLVADYTLSNGTLSLTNGISATGAGNTISAVVILQGGPTWTVGTSSALLVSGVISGGHALTKAGAGTLTLAAANTYTGPTTVSAGVLVAGVDNALGAGNLTVAGSASFLLTGHSASVGAVTISVGTLTGGTLNSTGGFYLTGTNISRVNTVLTGDVDMTVSISNQTGVLGAVNTYTGDTYINGASSAACLAFGVNNAIAGGGGVYVNWGTLSLASYSGTVGGVSLGRYDSAAGTSSSGTISGSGALTSTAGFAVYSGTVTAALAGSGGLTKSGGSSSSVLIAGAAAYTGTTSVTGGILLTNSTASLPGYNASGSVSIAAGAAVGGYVGSGYWTEANFATLLTNAKWTAGAALAIDTTKGSYSYSTVLANGGAGGTASVGLTKCGSNMLTLANVNTYTGLTTVLAGTLAEGVNNAISTGAVTVDGGVFALSGHTDSVGAVTLIAGTIAGGTLSSTSGFTVTSGSISAGLAGSVGLTSAGGSSSIAILTGINTYSGATNVAGGVLVTGSTASLPGYNASGSVSVAAGAAVGGYVGSGYWSEANFATLVVNAKWTAGAALAIDTGKGDYSYSTVLANGGTGGTASIGLTKTGSNALTLAAANTYSGTTTVLAGTLTEGVNSALGAGDLTIAGGSYFNLAGHTDSVGFVSLTQGFVVGSGTLASTVGFYVAWGSVTTVMAGPVDLTKSATPGETREVVLNCANLHTGTTYVYDGTLTAGIDNALGTGGLTISTRSGGAAAVFNLAGHTDSVGLVTLVSGTLAGGGTLTSTSGFLVQSGSVNVVLAGAVSLTKTGFGAVILRDNNAYTGGTAIYGGTLQIGNYTATGSGTVALTGNLNTGDSTNGTGTLAFNRYSSSSPSYSLDGVISGNGAVTQFAGTLTFTQHNTYTGLTTVSGSTLVEGADDALGTGSLTIVSGGVFDLSGHTDSVGGALLTKGTITHGTLTSTAGFVVQWGLADAVLAGPVGLTKDAAHEAILAAANAYTGATCIAAGTLTLRNQNAVQNSTLTMKGGSLVFDSAVGANAFNFGGLAGSTSGAGYDIALQNVAGSAIVLTVGGNNASTTYAGVLRGAGGLTKAGAGTLTLSAANTYTGTTTVNAGALVFQGTASINAALTYTKTDVAAGTLVFDYSANTSSGAGIAGQVNSILSASYNGGTNSWASGTIYSTLANSNSTNSYALGWTNNTTINAVTVRVTLYGDTTMDGTVNIYDLGQVLANYNKSGVWATGDFNYDGTVNIYDLGTILANYNKSISLSEVSVNPADYAGLDGQGVAALRAAGVNVVPEPGTLALLASGAVGLAAFVRRRWKGLEGTVPKRTASRRTIKRQELPSGRAMSSHPTTGRFCRASAEKVLRFAANRVP
jgi:fibronectin-binding autotransporter adhesin